MDKRIALIVATVASFITPFMASSITIALPAIGAEYSMTAVTLAWVATAYLFATAVLLVPFGKIADMFGRKKVFLAGMAVYTVASALCAFAPSASFLITLRVVQGIGAAMIFSTSIAIVTSVYPAGGRGRALGITTAAVYLGLSLGPVLGGFLTQHFGWRSIFITAVPIGALVIALTMGKLKEEWREASGERFDLAGALIFAFAFAAIMYGFTRLPGALGVWLILGGAAGIVAFVLVELRVRSPLLHMDLFACNRVFAFSNLAALINYSASFAVGFLMSLYLQHVRSLTPQEAGLILVAQPVVMAVFSPFAGRLSDRIESRIVASVGMALTGAALVIFIFVGASTSLAAIVANLMLLGLGFALFSSPNTNAVMGSVDKEFYGVASATLATMRMTGQVLSMAVAMLVFSMRMGAARIAPELEGPFVESLSAAFTIFSVLCFAGVFASLARGKARGARA